MATLPVTMCSNKRSFSTLRRVKTYLQSTMGNDRMNGLVLLNIHRDVRVDASCVLDKLAEKPCCLPLRLQWWIAMQCTVCGCCIRCNIACVCFCNVILLNQHSVRSRFYCIVDTTQSLYTTLHVMTNSNPRAFMDAGCECITPTLDGFLYLFTFSVNAILHT